MRTETITIYRYSELSEEAKATAYKAWEPDYAFEADNRRTLEAFCDAFGIRMKGEGDWEAYDDNGDIRRGVEAFEPTGFYLDDIILGPAYLPAEHKAFEDVVNECLYAFFEACEKDREYTRSQEYFADFAENNDFEFYGNGIRIRHR